MQKQWNSMLGVAEASDEENDIVKVFVLKQFLSKQLAVVFYFDSLHP